MIEWKSVSLCYCGYQLYQNVMFFNFGHKKRSFFLIIITLILCIYEGMPVMTWVWRSEDSLQEMILSSHHLGSWWLNASHQVGQRVPLLSCWLLRAVFTSSDDSLDRVIQTLRRKLGNQKPQNTTFLHVKPAELWGFWPFGQIKDSSPTRKVGGWVDRVWTSHPWLFELSMSLLPDILGEKESTRILD